MDTNLLLCSAHAALGHNRPHPTIVIPDIEMAGRKYSSLFALFFAECL